MRLRRAEAALLALALAGCQQTPPLKLDPPAPAAAWKEDGPWRQAQAAPAPAGQWWAMFGDPGLSALEERLERESPDLAVAAARAEQATAAVGAARAALFPAVGVGADVARRRVSADRPLGPGVAATYNDYGVGASLSWEADLFGRVRAGVAASSAEAAASAADLQGARLSLQARLAAAWFELRGHDRRLALLDETVEAFDRAHRLTATRHAGGIASGMDVNRAETQLASAQAEREAVAAARAATEHAIAILVGENPSAFAIPASTAEIGVPVVPAGLPSDLLERRPDIAAAASRVAAANARIGVARAAMFPSVTLGAGAGFAASTGGLLSAGNGVWALGPLSAALAVFDGGARRANIRISRAEYAETTADYRRTVLNAFREVEDNLAAGRQLERQEAHLATAAAAAGRTRDIAMTRYRDGASDFLEVVTAQTAALDAERALLAVRIERLETAADTVRAVGGVYGG